MTAMKRLAPLVLVGLLASACGDSTDSSGQAPAGNAGSESGSTTVSSEPVPDDTSSDVVATEPPATEPPITEPPATDPAATDPVVTGPETEGVDEPEPEVTVAPVPSESVARFFAGNGNPEFPWVPLGAWDGSSWLAQEFDADGNQVPLPAAEIANVVVSSLDLPDGPDATMTGLVLGEEQPYCVGDESGPLITLPREIPETPSSLGYDVIAVTADWAIQPRPVRQVGLESPIYREVGAALFDGQVATAADGSVVQAVRVDLDGNGIEEVLVTYERQEATDFGGEGDFTGVYARYPSADGTVDDVMIASYVSSEPVDFPTPGRYTLAAVADLNGDGVMEVMVRDRFWESGGMQVFALTDGRLAPVGGGGCGV